MRETKSSFYQSRAWKKKRASILRRDGYLDRIEKRYGRTVAADTVHHILPLADYPQYKLCGWNLTSVSKATHNRLEDKHGELTDEGRRLMERTIRQHFKRKGKEER